jgi:hypothetical protein
MSFDTPLALCGPLRKPLQMLADQEYGGHASIHDDSMAEKLGFRAGPIEGPTHFSQFAPLMVKLWGPAWFERGCMSAHYQNMVVEGEEVRAFVEIPAEGATLTRAWAQKADGTPVLEASASLGSGHGQTLLDQRLAQLRPPQRLVILADLAVGMKGADDELVRMDADQHMGNLYPFSLNQKLAKITESSPWYSDPASTPWGRATSRGDDQRAVRILECSARFPSGRGSLFADQEIRMMDEPLFVGQDTDPARSWPVRASAPSPTGCARRLRPDGKRLRVGCCSTTPRSSTPTPATRIWREAAPSPAPGHRHRGVDLAARCPRPSCARFARRGWSTWWSSSGISR